MVSLRELAKEELILPGNASCAGCNTSLSIKLALKGLGKRTIFVVPACCTSVLQGVFPLNSLNIPVLNIAFASTGAAASGVVAGLRTQGIEDVTVVGWAGDGGTVDIGIQALSGAAERGTDFIYVCYDNEAYQNTGIQRSGSTPFGAWTTTTPIGKLVRGKDRPKKNLPAIIAAHGAPYIATASIAYPLDFIKKLKKAAAIEGPTYVHVHAPCSPGWRIESNKTIEVARLAVLTSSWVLYEIENGKVNVTFKPPKRRPIADYLKMQGRFRHLTDDEITEIQRMVDNQCKGFGIE